MSALIASLANHQNDKMAQRIFDYISKKEGDFNDLSLDVFAYQYEHCEAYRHYCRQLHKTPETLETWQEIPAVSTEVFREFTLSTLSIDKAQYVFETSGTSQGNKGKHYYHDMSLYNAAIQFSFMKGINLSNEDKPVFRVLTPSFADVSTSSLFYMFQQAIAWYGDEHSQFYFQQNELNCCQLLQDLQEDIQKNQAVVLLGTAFSFVNFCDYLIKNKIILPLPKGSRLLETGGLKGRTRTVSRNELYELFSKRLGLDLRQCFSEYGMTELSSQCYSQPNSHIFSSPHWMKTRIIDPQTGSEVAPEETGLVQFFDLANYTAVSAVITSDLAIKRKDGFELIGRAPKAVLRGCSTAFEP